MWGSGVYGGNLAISYGVTDTILIGLKLVSPPEAKHICLRPLSIGFYEICFDMVPPVIPPKFSPYGDRTPKLSYRPYIYYPSLDILAVILINVVRLELSFFQVIKMTFIFRGM